MTLAVVMSRALDGLMAPQVHVEVQLATGLPSFMQVKLQLLHGSGGPSFS